MLLLMENIFSVDFIFTIRYNYLSKISLLPGITRHCIDFGYCNSLIFIFLGCFMSKQSRYINVLNSFKHKR